MQLDTSVDCGCQEVDVANVNAAVLSFGPPSVSQVQKLLGKECTVRQQISCSGEVPQEASALVPVVPLQCRENRLRRKAAPMCLQLRCKHFVCVSSLTSKNKPNQTRNGRYPKMIQTARLIEKRFWIFRHFGRFGSRNSDLSDGQAGANCETCSARKNPSSLSAISMPMTLFG